MRIDLVPVEEVVVVTVGVVGCGAIVGFLNQRQAIAVTITIGGGLGHGLGGAGQGVGGSNFGRGGTS